MVSCPSNLGYTNKNLYEVTEVNFLSFVSGILCRFRVLLNTTYIIKKINLTESPDLTCCRLTCQGFWAIVTSCQWGHVFSMQVHRGCQRPLHISSLEGEGGFAPEGFTVSLALCYGMLEIASQLN